MYVTCTLTSLPHRLTRKRLDLRPILQPSTRWQWRCFGFTSGCCHVIHLYVQSRAHTCQLTMTFLSAVCMFSPDLGVFLPQSKEVQPRLIKDQHAWRWEWEHRSLYVGSVMHWWPVAQCQLELAGIQFPQRVSWKDNGWMDATKC